MSREVSRPEFERDAGVLLREVAADGDSVTITESGHPVAVLASYRSVTSLAGLAGWGRAGGPKPLDPAGQRVLEKAELGFSPDAGTLGSDSGRQQLHALLADLGVPVLDTDLLGDVYAGVLELCEAKDTLYAEDVRALAQELIAEAPQRMRLLAVTVTSTTGLPATAEVTLSLGTDPAMRREQGDGPLDAAIRAIERLTGMSPAVRNFSVVAATPGHDAMAEAMIELELEGRTVVGAGASTNAVEAGIHAYVNALNFLVEARGQAAT